MQAAAIIEMSDPSILAVERVWQALRLVEAANSSKRELRTLITSRRRRSYTFIDEVTIIDTDDPRWISNCNEVLQAEFSAKAAFQQLMQPENHPTTLNGVVSIMRLVADDNTDTGEFWSRYLSNICASTIARLAP